MHLFPTWVNSEPHPRRVVVGGPNDLQCTRILLLTKLLLWLDLWDGVKSLAVGNLCPVLIPASLICPLLSSNHLLFSLIKNFWRPVNQGYFLAVLHRQRGYADSATALTQGNASCYWTLLTHKQCSGCTRTWALDSIFTSCCLWHAMTSLF